MNPKRKRRRKLTQADLRTLGVQPGLQAIRYPAGQDRARVEQLAPEGPERRRDFARRLTLRDEGTKGSEGGSPSK